MVIKQTRNFFDLMVNCSGPSCLVDIKANICFIRFPLLFFLSCNAVDSLGMKLVSTLFKFKRILSLTNFALLFSPFLGHIWYKPSLDLSPRLLEFCRYNCIQHLCEPLHRRHGNHCSHFLRRIEFLDSLRHVLWDFSIPPLGYNFLWVTWPASTRVFALSTP
jgi:hypothetical protein